MRYITELWRSDIIIKCLITLITQWPLRHGQISCFKPPAEQASYFQVWLVLLSWHHLLMSSQALGAIPLLYLAFLCVLPEDWKTPTRRKSKGLTSGLNLVPGPGLPWFWELSVLDRIDHGWQRQSRSRVGESLPLAHKFRKGRKIQGSHPFLCAVGPRGNCITEAYPKMILNWF